MSLDDEADALRKIPMFANLSPAKLKLLAFTSDALTFMDGEAVVHVGDRSEHAFVIIDGEVEVLTYGDHGVASFVVGKNQLVGEMGVLNDAPRSATIRAKGEVRVLRLSAETLLNLLSENPEAALHVMRLLADRLSSTLQKYEEAQRRLDAYERSGKPAG